MAMPGAELILHPPPHVRARENAALTTNLHAPHGPALPASPAPADDAVFAAARRGERAAWACLYDRYARLVHAVVLARVPPSDAEDLVHDVFAKAMRRSGDMRDPQAVGAWLASIARNCAADHLRRRRRSAGVLAESERPDHPAMPASAAAPPEMDAADVLAAIQRLPDAYRETLVLRLVEGMTGPQIALQTGMTHGSVRVNLHRGMQLLREALGMGDHS